MVNFLKNYWTLIFILIVWFIFSSPFFLKGLVPYPSTYQVNHFPPWNSYEKFWGPVKNGAMPDIIDQIYPWRHFTVQTLKSGQIPFWNPNSFSGNPHLANYQSAVLSPFNILFFIVPFINAWSILILLQPLFAGLFTYFLLREFKVSKEGSLIGSIAFMFSGFMVVWRAYGTLSFAISFLPMALWGIERWFNKRDKFSLLLFAISIPLSFFSGHFQTSLYFLIFIILFLIFKIITIRKYYLPILISFGAGFLISLFQIVPSIQFYLESSRSGIFNQGGGIPFFYLINIFSPDFFGNPVTRNDWFGYYSEWASFIGIIPFVLALFAIEKRNKISLFFIILGAVSLIFALNSPLQQVISNLKIPVISTSNPNRIIVLFSFAFAVASGFGFDKLRNLIEKKSTKKLVRVLLSLTILFVLIWISILFTNLIPYDKKIIARRNFVFPTIIFSLFILAVFLNVFIKNKKKNLILLVLVILVAIDSLRFAQKWMPFDPKNLVFPSTPVISAAQKDIGNGRIFGNFLANVDTYYNLPSVEGYDPLYIGRYGEFIRTAATGKYTEGERSVVRLDRRGKYTDRVLDFLGVNLIFNPISDTNQGWAFPVWADQKRFTKIYQDDKFQLFKNNTAMSRAQLFYKYEVINNPQKELGRFYSSDFDFRNTLLLEQNPVLDLKEGNGTTQIISYTPDKVLIKVKTSTPALLFLSDNYYPGWKAEVNGKETKVLRADYTFRAVEVQQGESDVLFYFEPGF